VRQAGGDRAYENGVLFVSVYFHKHRTLLSQIYMSVPEDFFAAKNIFFQGG
jgi:hypothetical protein